MSERELATVRMIDAIEPIEGADAIEVAIVGGWAVVVKKGEFAAGDLAVYLEIDSWVPTELAPFLSKGQEPRVYNGVKGERLRTIKLRGQISQGLLLPLSYSDESEGRVPVAVTTTVLTSVQEGDNVTELLGIQKWEAPQNPQLAGQARGNFPPLIPKTDQERVQNLKRNLEKWGAIQPPLTWETTEKLEGSSMTAYLPVEGEFEVCSRNLSLKRDEANAFWKQAIALDLETRMRDAELFGCALQGELIGEGIQGNIYKLTGHQFRVFDIYSVRERGYLSAPERDALLTKMGLAPVPVIKAESTLVYDMQTLLAMAEGKSQLLASQEREGVVFKCIQKPELSFKAISNKYLLKTGG